MNRLVSIIIPIKNSEEYIVRAIESIQKQTYQDWELLLIDDNSKDCSYEICSRFVSNNSKIKLFKNTKHGVSSARNLGIKNSCGDYLVFLDSDDWLEKDIIEKAVSGFEEDKIVQWGIVKENTLNNIEQIDTSREHMLANCIYLTDDKLGPFFRSACAKMFSSRIIKENGIEFPEDLYMGEDSVFVMRYLQFVSGYKLVSKTGYTYFVNPKSSSNRYKEDLFDQNEKQLRYILKFVDDSKSEELLAALSNFKWWMFNSLLDNSLRGFKNHLISLFSITKDAKRWYRNNRNLMQNKPVCPSRIYYEFRKQYESKSGNVYLMMWFWFLNRIRIYFHH